MHRLSTAVRVASIRRRRNRKEGATMLVVMLVLLSITGLAVFSVHSTSRELRASGHLRQSMQARTLAGAGVEAAFALVDNPVFGAKGLEHAIQVTQTNGTYALPPMEPYEPALLPSNMAYRIFSDDIANFGTFGPADADVMGPHAGARQPYTPQFEVDVTDYQEFPMELPGGGSGNFSYAAFTSRSRLRLTGGDFAGTAATDVGRAYHDVSQGARAYGVFGPIL